MKRLTILFLFVCAIAFGQTRVYNHNIDGLGWISLHDTLKLDFSVQDYYVASRGGDRLSFIASDSNMIVDMFGGDGDGLEEIIWNLWGKGTPTDISQAHWLRVWYNLAGDEYCITTKQTGAQAYRDLLLSADGSPDQFKLLTDGNISFADTLKGGVWGGVEIDTSSFARSTDTIIGDLDAAQINGLSDSILAYSGDSTLQGIFIDTTGIADGNVIVYDAVSDTFKTKSQNSGSTATAQSTNYNAADGDFILMTSGAANDTIFLPAAASNTDAIIEVKKVDSGSGDVIIDGNLAETIDGALTQTILSQYTSLTLHCDGNNWYIK